MTLQNCIKILSEYCDIQDYKVRNYANETAEKMVCFTLSWKNSCITFMFFFDLAKITKRGLMSMLCKQLDNKPKVTNDELLFWFKYLTKKQQRIVFKYNPSLFGKVYKYEKR